MRVVRTGARESKATHRAQQGTVSGFGIRVQGVRFRGRVQGSEVELEGWGFCLAAVPTVRDRDVEDIRAEEVRVWYVHHPAQYLLPRGWDSGFRV